MFFAFALLAVHLLVHIFAKTFFRETHQTQEIPEVRRTWLTCFGRAMSGRNSSKAEPDESDDVEANRLQQQPKPAACPGAPSVSTKLQSFLNKNSRVVEKDSRNFRWDILGLRQLRQICQEAGQTAIYSRIAQTADHSLFHLVLKVFPNVGFHIDDQGGSIPDFAVRFCFSNLHPILNVNVQSNDPQKKLVGFDACVNPAMPNFLANFSAADDVLVILVQFQSPPGSSKASTAGGGRGAKGGVSKGNKAAQEPVPLAVRNQIVAAVFLATFKCMSQSQSLPVTSPAEPEPSKAQGIESRLEQLLEVTEGMAKRNEYRFNRMEMQLEKMERLYAQVPPRGKKKEDDKGDPLSVLRQAFKTSLVQLDALEKQRAHLNVALDAQTKELHAFQGTCAAQNQQITAELRSLLQEVQDLKKCNAQQSAD
jgi:hypothetical protein